MHLLFTRFISYFDSPTGSEVNIQQWLTSLDLELVTEVQILDEAGYFRSISCSFPWERYELIYSIQLWVLVWQKRFFTDLATSPREE